MTPERENNQKTSWVLAVVLVLTVLSALAVVYNSYLNRQLFISLHALNQQHTQMRIDFGRLQLEYGSWASPAVIEQLASQRLHMQAPLPEQLVLVPVGSQNSVQARSDSPLVAELDAGGER